MSVGLSRAWQCVAGRVRASYRRGIVFRAWWVVEVGSAPGAEARGTKGDGDAPNRGSKARVSHGFRVDLGVRRERNRRPVAAWSLAPLATRWTRPAVKRRLDVLTPLACVFLRPRRDRLADLHQALVPAAIGEEAVVTTTHEPFR
jgi:hypothetical protein